MKKDKNIEQLFQKEFESFEVQPSGKVWRGVRFELFIKNFLRFNPWSVNAWYIGGMLIIASVVSYSLLMRTEKSGSETEMPVKPAIAEVQDTPGVTVWTETGRLEADNGIKKTKTVVIKETVQAKETGDGNLPTEEKNLKPVPGQVKSTETTDLSTVSGDKTTSLNYDGQSVIAWFKCSASEGCAPLSISFRNYSQNAVRYVWSFGDGGTSDLADPSYIFDEPGTWFVSLTAISANNEINTFTDSVKVHPLPVARFSMDIQEAAGEGFPVYFYNYSRGADDFLWNFGDGTFSSQKDPDHYFNSKGRADIKLKVFSASGCVDSTVLYNAFMDGEPVFKFPTAFSPNTTGPKNGEYSRNSQDNDVFYPYVIEDPEEYQLKIFNRMGILLFESSDIHTGWDGYYREVLMPQGVYVWKARAKFPGGRSVVKMGDVTLLWGE